MKRIFITAVVVLSVCCLSCNAQPGGGFRGPGGGPGSGGFGGGVDKSGDETLNALKAETLSKFQQLTFNDTETGDHKVSDTLCLENCQNKASPSYNRRFFL